MLLCVPFHKSLPVKYPELAKAIKKVGTNPNHTLAVINLRSQDESAFLFGNALSDYFGRQIKVTLDDREESGIQASNRFFLAAMQAFKKFVPSGKEHPKSPMLYLDPTFRPTRPQWLDDLQTDYFHQGLPKVMGTFRGGVDEIPASVGPLLLSREFVDASTLAAFLPDDIHWRDYLAWELKRNSVGISATALTR